MVCMPYGVRGGRQGACEARQEARQGACQARGERREAVSCKSTQALTCDRCLLALGVAGTCLYAIQSGEHVSKLRNDITSPGGTTGLCLFLKSTLTCVTGLSVEISSCVASPCVPSPCLPCHVCRPLIPRSCGMCIKVMWHAHVR